MGQLQLLMALAAIATLTITNTEAQGCPERFNKVGSRCLHVSTRYLEEERPHLFSWATSRKICQGMNNGTWTVDLVSNYDAQYLRLMSMEIKNNYPGLFQRSFIYWVGAKNYFGVWRWLDGTPIDVMSYIWYISAPHYSAIGSRGILVPSGSGGKRHYTYEYSPFYSSPSFICEAKLKSK